MALTPVQTAWSMAAIRSWPPKLWGSWPTTSAKRASLPRAPPDGGNVDVSIPVHESALWATHVVIMARVGSAVLAAANPKAPSMVRPTVGNVGPNGS